MFRENTLICPKCLGEIDYNYGDNAYSYKKGEKRYKCNCGFKFNYETLYVPVAVQNNEVFAEDYLRARGIEWDGNKAVLGEALALYISEGIEALIESSFEIGRSDDWEKAIDLIESVELKTE